MPEKQYPRRIPFIFPSSSLLGIDCSLARSIFRRVADTILTDWDDIVGSEIPKFDANEILDKTAAKLIPDHD